MSKYTPEEKKHYVEIVDKLVHPKYREDTPFSGNYAEYIENRIAREGGLLNIDGSREGLSVDGDSVMRINLDEDCPMEEPEGIISFDTVGKPKHYNYGEVEVLDYIEQVAELYPPTVAIHVANVIKYLSRAPLKNGVEDLEKAQYYLDRAIRNIKEQGIIVKLDETK